jgi:crossover junction endodeoxyribonuclease RuvC
VPRERAEIARKLRINSTDVEQRLWQALREAKVFGKVRRQHPIGDYIVDFAIPSAKLAIELDGGQHIERAEADKRRTADIEQHGYRIIRFWNHEVLENLDGVLESIRAAVAAPTSP